MLRRHLSRLPACYHRLARIPRLDIRLTHRYNQPQAVVVLETAAVYSTHCEYQRDLVPNAPRLSRRDSLCHPKATALITLRPPRHCIHLSTRQPLDQIIEAEASILVQL